jgi:gliding motility-associated-like protein
MRNLLLLLTVCSSLAAYSQRQNDTWLFGTWLGVKFNGTTRQVLPGKASAMYAPAGCASISDPRTGALVIYSNGRSVWGKDNLILLNGMLSAASYVPHCLIVPATDSRYYVFYSDELETIYHALVDMRLNNGKGAVVFKDRVYATGMDNQFTAIRMLHGQGHWIVTHRRASNQFHVFALTADSLYRTPIISDAGAPSFNSSKYYYGKMFSNRDGNRIILSFWDSDPNKPTGVRVQEFDFDKKCGVIRVRREYFPFITQSYETSAHAAYDAETRYLYISWHNNFGSYRLYQYDLSVPDPNITKEIIGISYEVNSDMQLAPDNRIYMTSSVNTTFTSVVSVINNPSLPQPLCDFQENALDFSTVPFLGSIGAERFPEFIAETDTSLPSSRRPVMSILPACAGDMTIVEVPDSFPYPPDSVKWDFGDGVTSQQRVTSHIYTDTGSFTVSFTWYFCGFPAAIRDTIHIGKRPVLDIGADTIVCRGTLLELDAGPGKNYRWSTGDTVRVIQAKTEGAYFVTVNNGSCSAIDTILVSFHPSLETLLGDEYAICDYDHELVKLDAGEGFQNYRWTPTGDTSQWIIVGDLGQYYVVVKDYRGCKGEDGSVVKRKCPVSLYFPNVFTPNDDGLNDVFQPRGSDVISFSMSIYNRWGQLVYECKDLTQPWDGTSGSVATPSDVYVYYARYTGYTNKRLKTFEKKGSFTLMR